MGDGLGIFTKKKKKQAAIYMFRMFIFLVLKIKWSVENKLISF